MTIGDTVHDDRNKRVMVSVMTGQDDRNKRGMVSVVTGQEERDGDLGTPRV